MILLVFYVVKTVCALISATLCVPVLLGLLFLKHNNIVIDTESHIAIDKIMNFDLLQPPIPSLKATTMKPKLTMKFIRQS